MPLVTSPGITGKPKEPERQERLGLHLKDVQDMDPVMRANLFRNLLDFDGITVLDKWKKLAVIPLKGGLLRTAAAVDVARGMDRKAERPPARAFKNDGRGWRPVPAGVLLTVIKNGTVALNPLFWDDVLEEEPLPPG